VTITNVILTIVDSLYRTAKSGLVTCACFSPKEMASVHDFAQSSHKIAHFCALVTHFYNHITMANNNIAMRQALIQIGFNAGCGSGYCGCMSKGLKA
jgi:hypothetical protein